jgi:hypothetical protein
VGRECRELISAISPAKMEGPDRGDRSERDRDRGDREHKKKRSAAAALGGHGSTDGFVCFRQFSNSLPNAPSGPFFRPKKIDAQESFEKYAKYEVSSLEKSFIWQPHFGADVGINLDLVDQDAMLMYVPNQVMDPGDMKFLQVADSTRKKSRGGDLITEKPWWLRNTTYLENNLFKVNTRELPTQGSKTIRPVSDPLSIPVIDASFTEVEKTLKAQIEQNKDKQLEWCVDFVPTSLDSKILFSLIRFDEDPRKLVSDVNKKDEGKRKVRKSLLTNARMSKEGDGRKEGVLVSLVASTDPQIQPSENSGEAAHFDWISDFKMDSRPAEADDYLIVLTESNGVKEVAEYYQLQNRVELRQLARLECDPHDAFVSRRPSSSDF